MQNTIHNYEQDTNHDDSIIFIWQTKVWYMYAPMYYQLQVC